MLNILKMDLYRIRKMKSTYILTIITILGCLLLCVSLNLDGYDVQNISVFSLFSLYIQCGIILILLPIFAALFSDGDNKSGFVKTIGGLVPDRAILAGSKIIGCIIFTIGIMLVSFLGCCLFSAVIFGHVSFDGFKDNYKFILSQIFTHCTLSVFISMLAIWWKSGASSMAVGFIFTSGIPNLIFMGINYVLHRFLSVPDSFDINKYFFIAYLGKESYSISTGMIVCAVYFVISIAASLMIMSKRDVK